MIKTRSRWTEHQSASFWRCCSQGVRTASRAWPGRSALVLRTSASLTRTASAEGLRSRGSALACLSHLAQWRSPGRTSLAAPQRAPAHRQRRDELRTVSAPPVSPMSAQKRWMNTSLAGCRAGERVERKRDGPRAAQSCDEFRRARCQGDRWADDVSRPVRRPRWMGL